MVFKFIDARGHVHYRECVEVSFLGIGTFGFDEAVREDGEGSVLHYDTVDHDQAEGFPTRYFSIVPTEGGGRREVIATNCSAAWLMSDKGKTIENLMLIEIPGSIAPHGLRARELA